MRTRRIKPSRPSLYHLYSRLVPGIWFTEPEKTRFRQFLRQQADFCGVEILTFTVMGTHFHIGAHTPERYTVPDAEIVERVKRFYGPKSERAQTLEKEFKQNGCISEQLRERYNARMGDVSVFMKELKQRFTIWYNAEHERYGTLWAERFKSTLFGPDLFSVILIACYIDLNAVRARMVKDPLDYLHCGYAEATATDGPVRHMLVRMLGFKDWNETSRQYRMLLFGEAGAQRHSDKAVVDPEEIRKVMKAGGKVESWKTRWVSCRYIIDGLAIGTADFVEGVRKEYPQYFGKNRKPGGRKMKGGDWGGLCVFRDLQKNVFGKDED